MATAATEEEIRTYLTSDDGRRMASPEFLRDSPILSCRTCLPMRAPHNRVVTVSMVPKPATSNSAVESITAERETGSEAEAEREAEATAAL